MTMMINQQQSKIECQSFSIIVIRRLFLDLNCMTHWSPRQQMQQWDIIL